MAILILDNLSNVIFDDPNAPSGGVVVSGVSFVTASYPAASGGSLKVTGLAGTATGMVAQGAGQLQFTGLAGTSTAMTADGLGRVQFTGLAPTSLDSTMDTTGGLTITGIAGNKATMKWPWTGKLAFSGNTFFSNSYEYDGNGKPRAKGTGDLVGQARVRGFITLQVSGDLGFSGDNPDTQQGFPYKGNGALSLNGFASVTSNAFWHVAEGSIGFGNNAAGLTVGLKFSGFGALAYLGSSPLALGFIFQTSGGFSFGSGDPQIVVHEHFELPVFWKIRESSEFEKSFTWGVGERAPSFFRVVGKCKPARCPPVNPLGCPDDSKFTFIVNIFARNLIEVCQKLREREFMFPIQSIQRFSTPAQRSDFTEETDPSCNQLIDVTPPFTFLPCQDLLVDVNAKAHFGMDMKAVLVLGVQEATGGIRFTGRDKPMAFFSYDATGSLGLTGLGNGEQHNYAHAPVGSIGFSGTYENLTMSHWEWQGEGSLAATGVGRVLVTLQHWFWESSGLLGLTGTEKADLTMAWEPTGGFTTGQSSALGPGDFLPYFVHMTGGVGFTGLTDGAPGQHQYFGRGSLGLSSYIRWVSSAITIEGNGGSIFTWAGTTGNRLENGGGGKVMFTGVAGAIWAPTFLAHGAMGWKGTAGVISSYQAPSGALGFGGSALVNCSDLGIITMHAGMTFKVAKEGVIFRFEPAETLQPVFRAIKSPCCPLTLPLRLRVEHELASSNYFSRFLQRNSLFIDQILDLYYNSREKAWYNTIHFEGFAPDFPTVEQWTMTFGWQCVNADQTDVLGNLGSNWRFSFIANLRSFNNPNIPQRVTRIVAGFDINRVCFSNKSLSFPFILNTATSRTTPATIQPLVYIDDIGMFKSPKFVARPEIKFKILAVVVDIPPVVVDIGHAVKSAMLIGSDIPTNHPPTVPVG
jgi:hypothetical protein